jgi:hypothetical protein
VSNIKPFLIFLRELGKEVAVDMKKAIVVCKSNAKTASDLERQSGVGL